MERTDAQNKATGLPFPQMDQLHTMPQNVHFFHYMYVIFYDMDVIFYVQYFSFPFLSFSFSLLSLFLRLASELCKYFFLSPMSGKQETAVPTVVLLSSSPQHIVPVV